MSSGDFQEYDDNLTALLEAIWGEGYLSPGGNDEVDRYLDGLDLGNKTVLDIGCGLGGVDLHLARGHAVKKVIGIDIEQSLIDKCDALARKYQLEQILKFRCVEPGPLPFNAVSFDIVTSKDSIIHIPDKHALAADIFRILKPGGWFVASDWLAGYEDEPSDEMQAYLVAEGLDFGLATSATYVDAMQQAGFVDVDTVDRNDWYRQQARLERDQLKNELYEGLASAVGAEFLEHEIEVWDKMIIAINQGELRPTHLRGRKPKTF